MDEKINNSNGLKLTLSDLITSITNGFDFRDYKEEGTPYIKVANVKQGYLDFSNIQFIELKSKDLTKKIQLEKGNILLTRKGTFGYAFSLPNDNDFIISSEIFYLEINQNIIYSKYLEIFLNSTFGQLQFDRVKIGAIMGSLSQEAIKNIIVILPSKTIQERVIALYTNNFNLKNERIEKALNILRNIDEIISKRIGFEFPKIKETKIFATKRTSFESRLDPHFYLPNFKSLIDNIRKADNAQLGDLVEFSKETWNQKDGFEKEFPYIEISEIDLASGKVNNISILPIGEAPSRAKMIVRANDIIVSTTRPHRGAISLITNSLDGFIASTGFAVLRNLKSDIISKEYLYYILRTQICLQQMLQRSSGGSYPAITAEELKNIYIPIPSKEVQNEVVEEIKRYIEEAERLKNEANLEFEVAKKEIENLILN